MLRQARIMGDASDKYPVKQLAKPTPSRKGRYFAICSLLLIMYPE